MNQFNSPRQYPRRNYYIDKKFQIKFIAQFWLIVAIGSLFVVAAVYWLARNTTTVGIIDGRVAVHTTAEYLLPLMLQTVAIQLAVVSFFTIIMTLFVSHKIAGPLYRLKATLRALGNGNLRLMHLRHRDQLQEVASSYNEALEKLNDKIKRIKDSSSIEEMREILDTFKLS
jgi:methyl-accepting chemotaxis protein